MLARRAPLRLGGPLAVRRLRPLLLAVRLGVVALAVVLQERVEPLVHPRPLPLVRGHDHGEPVVAHLVDGHADEPALGGVGVGAVGLGTAAAEGDHRVLHPAHGPVGVHGLGVRVLEGQAAVRLHGLDGGARRHLVPQGHGVARIQRVDLDDLRVRPVLEAGRVPDVDLRADPGEVAHVLGLEVPRERAALRRPALGLHDLVGLDDEDRLLGGVRLGQALALRGGEDLLRVLQLAGAVHDVVPRHRDAHVVVAELQVELAAAHELVGLPPVHVVVDAHAREPLRVLVEPPVVDQLLGAAPRVGHHVMPVDLEGGGGPRGQRLLQVHAHHRVVDAVVGVGERAVLPHQLDARQRVAEVRCVAEAQEATGLRAHALGQRALRRAGTAVLLRRLVLVELHPEETEHVGGVVVVRDPLRAVDAVVGRVQRDRDLVVGLLLPVARPGHAGGVAVVVGIRPLVQDPEHGLVRLRPVVVQPLLGAGGRRVGQGGDGEEERGDPGSATESGVRMTTAHGRLPCWSPTGTFNAGYARPEGPGRRGRSRWKG